MSVTVVLPGALRPEVDGARQLELKSDGTVRDILAELGERWPRLSQRVQDEQGNLRRHINLYVNSEDCRALGRENAPVPAGAEVMILPSVAGG